MQWPLFKFIQFLFENEVLGYNGGILITVNNSSENEICFIDTLSETGLAEIFVAMKKFTMATTANILYSVN